MLPFVKVTIKNLGLQPVLQKAIRKTLVYIMWYSYRLTQVFWTVRREAVTLVSAFSAVDASTWIPLSSWSRFDDSVPSCFSSSMIPLSSVVNGWETFIGPASVFPAEFKNVNMTSKKVEKIILLFCGINYASILKMIWLQTCLRMFFNLTQVRFENLDFLSSM